jgi:predicted ribosome quality control (RQC) complex YloA/Tae2 family protein
VGRSARENEEVTFRLARRGDLWLHARQRTGAHVIVQAQNENVPQEIVEEAARLAAYFSEGRNDSAVDVDVTHVRNVRKIPGGAPGRVTYRHFQTMHVQPGLQGWQPLSPSGRPPGG